MDSEAVIFDNPIAGLVFPLLLVMCAEFLALLLLARRARHPKSIVKDAKNEPKRTRLRQLEAGASYINSSAAHKIDIERGTLESLRSASTSVP